MSYRPRYRNNRNAHITCAFCKKTGHHIAQCSVLNNMECQNCYQRGHTTNRCPNASTRPPVRRERTKPIYNKPPVEPTLRKPVPATNRFIYLDSSSDEEFEYDLNPEPTYPTAVVSVTEPTSPPKKRAVRRVHFANDEPDCYGPLEKPLPTSTKIYETDAPPSDVSLEKVETPEETDEFLSNWMTQKRSTNAWRPTSIAHTTTTEPEKKMPASWADWESSSDEDSDEDSDDDWEDNLRRTLRGCNKESEIEDILRIRRLARA